MSELTKEDKEWIMMMAIRLQVSVWTTTFVISMASLIKHGGTMNLLVASLSAGIIVWGLLSPVLWKGERQ